MPITPPLTAAQRAVIRQAALAYRIDNLGDSDGATAVYGNPDAGALPLLTAMLTNYRADLVTLRNNLIAQIAVIDALLA